eukprot:3921433-Rhodomonas_salina.2
MSNDQNSGCAYATRRLSYHLPTCYAIPGTDIGCAAIQCVPFSVRMSGTQTGYGATSALVLRPTMLLRVLAYPVRTPGTKICYAATSAFIPSTTPVVLKSVMPLRVLYECLVPRSALLRALWY